MLMSRTICGVSDSVIAVLQRLQVQVAAAAVWHAIRGRSAWRGEAILDQRLPNDEVFIGSFSVHGCGEEGTR